MGSCYMALERYDEAERSFKLAMTRRGRGRLAGRGGRRRGALEDRGAAQAQDRRARDSHRGHVVPGTRRSAFRQDYKGKVVLIDFWAAWCNPCRMEMPNVMKTYEELHKKGFEIIGVSLDNEQEKFQGYLRDNEDGMAPAL